MEAIKMFLTTRCDDTNTRTHVSQSNIYTKIGFFQLGHFFDVSAHLLFIFPCDHFGAYGNVGFSKGYNCDMQLKHEANCVSKWYVFSGKWRNGGKLILIVTMLFGTLKKYHLNIEHGNLCNLIKRKRTHIYVTPLCIRTGLRVW
ncbi:sodium transporter HKT1 [Artemisia annua]|uniref:Sodium transporter HKT1 n=1 Tax=Artemisia annua TaxID=35608 RepID=A0A2U1L008_ARTAN|nr:sodium transporter HKT1 [Artemisia annua]